jgi:hypothetical protein
MALPVVASVVELRVFYTPLPSEENPAPTEIEEQFIVLATGGAGADAEDAIDKFKPVFEAANPGVAYRINSAQTGARVQIL